MPDADSAIGDPGRGASAGERGRRPDIAARPLDVADAERWQRPEAVLRELYLDAQSRAIEAHDWYLADRLRKKRQSRRLRGTALILAAAGGLVPLVVVSVGQGVTGWGYVLLGLAGVCVGFDRFLGLTSGWTRNMVTAQKINRRLRDFQLEWTTLTAAQAQRSTVEPQEYLELLRGFVADLSDIMLEETSEWATEFQSGLNQLELQADRPRI